jgi:hypothetical protein
MMVSDNLSLLGIGVTLVVSTASLVLSVKNRRNEIREYIFKEQYVLFIGLSECISHTIDIFNECIADKKMSKDNDELLSKYLDDFYFLNDKYDIIIPNEFYQTITDIYKQGSGLHNRLLGGDFKKEVLTGYQNSCFDFVEDMREFLGIDKLSQENRALVGNPRIRTISAIRK